MYLCFSSSLKSSFQRHAFILRTTFFFGRFSFFLSLGFAYFLQFSEVSRFIPPWLLFLYSLLYQHGKRTVQCDLQSPICLYFFPSTSPEIISVTSLCKRTVQCDLQSPIIYLALILSNHVDSIVTSVTSVATVIGSGYAPFPI